MAIGNPKTRAPAAVSASSARARPIHPHQAGKELASGCYAGWTEERVPRPVSFRFLGRGVRDLRVGERLAARWLPVGGPDVRESVRGATVSLKWTGARSVSGSVARRRGGRLETVRFTAVHDLGP